MIKSPRDPKNFPSIKFLQMMYPLLEMLLENRLNARILGKIPFKPEGFQASRSYVNQVVSLTIYIKAGF